MEEKSDDLLKELERLHDRQLMPVRQAATKISLVLGDVRFNGKSWDSAYSAMGESLKELHIAAEIMRLELERIKSRFS